MAITLRQVAAIRVARGPIVLDGPVLTGTSIFTGESAFVARLDKRTHKEVWRKKKMAWVRSAHDDKILVYAGEAKETQLWNEHGKVLWKRRGNLGRRGDRLYLHEGEQLQVIDIVTGEMIEQPICPPGVPNLMHDGVLLLTHRVEIDPVHAFHLAERRSLWEANLTVRIRERYEDECHRGLSFVASHTGQFVASSGQHLIGVSLVDGSLRWCRPLVVPYSWVQAKGGRIYAWTTAASPTNATSTKVTFDLSSGEISRERTIPAAGENRFVIVDEASGEILVDRALASYGGVFRRFQEPQPGTVCKSHIVFTTRSGLLAVFRLSDGELVWQHQHRDQLFPPVFEDNRLYAACADGHIVVFEAEGGEL